MQKDKRLVVRNTKQWWRELKMVQLFEFKKTEIEGLIEVTPFNADDVRGCFTKDYSKEVFEKNGINYDLKEVFYTTSHKGVIRALHFQREIQQPKLVRCIYGHVYDVVVDLRKNSPTFKKWLGFDLIGDKHNEILVPAGCAHGYLVLEKSIVSYKCTEKFYGEYDDGIMWNDPDINVQWPLDKIGGEQNLILADKDKNLQSFAEFIEKYDSL
jgi:dTDP-4-dehydrorhamnose 3,5-epimerase